MEVKTKGKKPANKKTKSKRSSNLVGKNLKSTKTKPTTKSVRKISAIKPIPADIFSDKKRVIAKEAKTNTEITLAAEQATAKFTPVKTKKNSKISQALERARARAEKNYAIAAAKAKLAEERANARDEQALVNEIDNAETLITDENSVIDPLNAQENAQLNYVSEIKIAPVTSIEINGVNVDVSSQPAKKKIAKLRRITNWHRKMYFIAPAISAAAIACALTPIAIVKPIQSQQPVIKIDDDSSEGITIKSQNVHLNKDSTITLSTVDEERITNVDITIGEKVLDNNDYSFNQMNNVISIKANAMTSVDNIKLKVVTDAPRFEPKFEPTTAGIKNVTYSSKYAKFRKEFVITCELRDGYILDQDSLTSGLVLKVGDKQLTDLNDVEVKPVNDSNTKYTITIKSGIVNDKVSLSGAINKYYATMRLDPRVPVSDNTVTSFHDKTIATKEKIEDINDVMYLQDGTKGTLQGYKPTAKITVDNNGSPIDLIDGSDYSIKSVWRDGAYHYDLIWTENGRGKIFGPVTVDLSATTGKIEWNNPEVEKEKYTDIAVGMDSNRDINFKANVGGVEVKDIKIVEGADLGYALDEYYRLVPIPGTVQKVGTIKLLARIDNLTKEINVNVVQPYVTITQQQSKHDIKIGGQEGLSGFSADIAPSYIKDQVSKTPYQWESDNQHVITVTQDGDKVIVNGVTKGTTNVTAKTTLTGPTGAKYDCSGKYQVNAVMPTWDEASWEYIVKATNTFYGEYYKEGATEQEKIQAMKNLCGSFQDINYQEDISSDITDPDKQVEAHLSDFIGKEKTVTLNTLPHKMRIVGINHDTISSKDIHSDLRSKKALFTFDSENVVCGENGAALFSYWDYYPDYAWGTVKGKNWWFCADQYADKDEDKRISVLWKALNSEKDDKHIWWVNPSVPYEQTNPLYKQSVYTQLKNYFKDPLLEINECPIKLVSKCSGMKNDRTYTIPSGGVEWQNFALENYDAYCFTLTTREINMDQSQVPHPFRLNIPNGVKGEGEPYKLFELDWTKIRKRDIANPNTATWYMLASPIGTDPRTSGAALDHFGSQIYYHNDKCDWSIAKPRVCGSEMVDNSSSRGRTMYDHVSFAFCI